jgi:hypothetical protein
MSGLQPIHLCLGGILCSPVLIAVSIAVAYTLRRQQRRG